MIAHDCCPYMAIVIHSSRACCIFQQDDIMPKVCNCRAHKDNAKSIRGNSDEPILSPRRTSEDSESQVADMRWGKSMNRTSSLPQTAPARISYRKIMLHINPTANLNIKTPFFTHSPSLHTTRFPPSQRLASDLTCSQ